MRTDFLDPSRAFGRIARGQRADLVLLKGDPVADIRATESVVDVFLDGRRVARSRTE